MMDTRNDELNQEHINDLLTTTMKLLTKNEVLLERLAIIINRVEQIKQVPSMSEEEKKKLDELIQPFRELKELLDKNPPFPDSAEFLKACGGVEGKTPQGYSIYTATDLKLARDKLGEMHVELAKRLESDETKKMIDAVANCANVYRSLDKYIDFLSSDPDVAKINAANDRGEKKTSDYTREVANHLTTLEIEALDLQKIMLKQLDKKIYREIGNDKDMGLVTDEQAKQKYKDAFDAARQKVTDQVVKQETDNVSLMAERSRGVGQAYSAKIGDLTPQDIDRNVELRRNILSELQKCRDHYQGKNQKKFVQKLDDAIKAISSVEPSKLDGFAMAYVAGTIEDLNKFNHKNRIYEGRIFQSKNTLSATVKSIKGSIVAHQQQGQALEVKPLTKGL